MTLAMQPEVLFTADQVPPQDVVSSSVAGTGMLLTADGFRVAWLDLSAGETAWGVPDTRPLGPSRDCIVSVLTTSIDSNELFIEVADAQLAEQLGHPCQ